MTLIGWIVIAVGVIWVLLLAAGWLLSVIASFSGGMIDTAESGVSRLFDILGKRHLARIYHEPESLTRLEAKLKTEDVDKTKLQNYEPKIYSPGPLEEATYQEELPRLFSRDGAVIATDVNMNRPGF